MSANPQLRDTEKSLRRMDHCGESGIRAVQIAGAEPAWLAEAARFNVERGAQIIDINMGCPAKKVCNKYAGSALMADLPTAKLIIEATVQAVAVPVTVKMRAGPCATVRNAVELALIAQDAGAVAVTIHGRTRDQLYKGQAEYDTVAAVKQALSIPVIANGDIDSPAKAKWVLDNTGVDAVMIGRAAQGNPWIFREIQHYLDHGSELAPPSAEEVHEVMDRHVAQLHAFYGEYMGLRIARKHVGWYVDERANGELFRNQFNAIENAAEQRQALAAFLLTNSNVVSDSQRQAA
jgi:tRNA-dihydrouridine synthase B